MNSSGIWQALRAKLAPARGRGHRIAVQYLVLSERDVAAMQAVFNQIGDALTLSLVLQRDAGDLVLVDGDMVSAMSAQLVQAFAEDRPVLMVRGLHRRHAPLLADPAALERCRNDLQRQLMDLPLVRRRSPHWGAAGWVAPSGPGAFDDRPQGPDTVPLAAASSGFDSAFDSTLDGAQLLAEEIALGQRSVLETVLRGMDDPEQRAFDASYGPEAQMHFDFRSRLVTVDPLAQQHLRVRREVPQPARAMRPQPDHLVRELDEVLWDLGLASAPFTLLGAPGDWWHTPVVYMADGQIERHTRLPVHLELARRLRSGAMSPSDLRRTSRTSVADLRRFLQAGLMLRLLHWAPTAARAGAAC